MKGVLISTGTRGGQIVAAMQVKREKALRTAFGRVSEVVEI
jgi:hypothetical protein